MKRFLTGLVLGVALTTGTYAAANQPIRLFVDGREISFPEAPPMMVNNRVLVPARPLAEALGAKVEWDGATQSVIVTSRVATAQGTSQPRTWEEKYCRPVANPKPYYAYDCSFDITIDVNGDRFPAKGRLEADSETRLYAVSAYELARAMEMLGAKESIVKQIIDSASVMPIAPIHGNFLQQFGIDWRYDPAEKVLYVFRKSSR